MAGERASRRVTPQPAPEIVVLACGLPRHQQAYLLDGVGRQARCEFVPFMEELAPRLAAMDRCDVIVLAPQDARGASAVPVVERLARDWPGTAVVVFFAPRAAVVGSPREFALAGAHQLVFEGVNNTAATLRHAIADARRECTADAVFAALQSLVPPVLHAMVHAVVSRPHHVTSVSRLASVLAVHRKTLVNHCARASFLPPAELIAWCRLCVVGYLLARTGATVESIALHLEYPSHTALRNVVKRYTGRRATDIRQGGGLAAVIQAFARRVGEYRASLAAPPPALPTL